MRSAMNEREVERFDAAMKSMGARVRATEAAAADTEGVWSELQRRIGQLTMSDVTSWHETSGRWAETSRVRPNRRVWVAVAMACACVALVVTLVWVRSRPAHIEPAHVPETTTLVTTTSAPPAGLTPFVTTTPDASAAGTGGLVLPSFPGGKLVASLSGVSATEWFALSDLGGPERQSYPLLWHTTDGGANWVDMQLSDEIAGMGDSVYFADPLNGWLGGARCCLASTHDGGATWTRVDGLLPDGVMAAPVAITASAGKVYILGDVAVSGNSTTGVFVSPIDHDEFVWTGNSMGDVRWGLDTISAQLAVTADAGWAIGFGVTRGKVSAPDGASRTVDGKWVPWELPCTEPLDTEEAYTRIDVPQLALGVSPSGAHLGVLCDVGNSDGIPQVFISADGGTTFELARPLPNASRFANGSWVAVDEDGTIVVGLASASGGLVVESTADGGISWRTDALFEQSDYFVKVSTPASGPLVVLANANGPDLPRASTAHARRPDGSWVPLGAG